MLATPPRGSARSMQMASASPDALKRRTHPPFPGPAPPRGSPRGRRRVRNMLLLAEGCWLPVLVVKCNPFIRTHHDTREGFVHQFVSLNLEVDLVTIKFVACKCRQYKIRIQNVFPTTKP